MNSQEAFLKQKEAIENYRQNQPELLLNPIKRTEAQTLQEIGIYNLPADRPLGYLRLFPQDFIVEEKTKAGNYIRINDFTQQENLPQVADEKNRTLYAHLIKIGVPTNIALEKAAQVLGISADKIGYAGLKDADAITAQLVAFPKIELSVAEVVERKIPNVHLTNFYYGSGSLNPGDLQENLFTITIRAKELIDEELFKKQLENLQGKGFLNYYQAQRFGGMRLLSHQLGHLILQQKYEETIKKFLFETSDYDLPLIKNLRQQAQELFPQWSQIKAIFEELPHTFFNELRVLNYLDGQPINYIGALFYIKEQTQLWVYAYASLLFNRYLSYLDSQHYDTNFQLPLLLTDQKDDLQIYADVLEAEGIKNLQQSLRPFKFIQLKKRLVDGRVFPKILDYKIIEQGLIISFSLSKGAYATTFLANLFELIMGLPIPEWVNLAEIDPKQILGQGDIQSLKQVFSEEFYSKQDNEKII